MEINKLNENSIIAVFPKRFDGTTSPEIEIELTKQINSGISKIACDFSNTNYMASSGVRVILSLYKKLKNISGELFLADLKPEVKNVFDMTCFSFMDKSLKVYPNVKSIPGITLNIGSKL
ncbi:STAS domain-containing protein [Candidatus Dependentiae bacterium]|nr:STAS domain-containing protein [Candidatus Dependentiae bacterium]